MAEGVFRGRHEPGQQCVLLLPPEDAPVEETPCAPPLQHLADAPLGLHAARTIMQVCELVSDLHVQRREGLLASLYVRSDPALLLLIRGRRSRAVQFLQLRVQAVHGQQLLRLAELHLADARRLQDASAGLLVGEHLHLDRVDGGVDHHPGAASELSTWRDVHEHRVAVGAQRVHDHGAVLEDLAVHVPGAAREAPPVGEDDQRQVLAAVEVLDHLRGLVG
mmetsp:Transcript_601/g.877  ORF Transcript_601/g.877 Transcript_601/m.877 type:complete len:221 (-) Transcript_601:3030-3692(-)